MSFSFALGFLHSLSEPGSDSSYYIGGSIYCGGVSVSGNDCDGDDGNGGGNSGSYKYDDIPFLSSEMKFAHKASLWQNTNGDCAFDITFLHTTSTSSFRTSNDGIFVSNLKPNGNKIYW